MAQSKKSFKKDNPALNFISTPEEAQDTMEPAPAQEALTPPKGYKLDPRFIETKSKRVQLLLQPSIVEAIKELADRKGLSMNETINEAIQEYLKNERE